MAQSLGCKFIIKDYEVIPDGSDNRDLAVRVLEWLAKDILGVNVGTFFSLQENLQHAFLDLFAKEFPKLISR